MGSGSADAADLRPLTANSHYPWSDQAPPEGVDQWFGETEWDPSGDAFYADLAEYGWDWPPTTDSSIVHVDLDGGDVTPVVNFPEDFWASRPVVADRERGWLALGIRDAG